MYFIYAFLTTKFQDFSIYFWLQNRQINRRHIFFAFYMLHTYVSVLINPHTHTHTTFCWNENKRGRRKFEISMCTCLLIRILAYSFFSFNFLQIGPYFAPINKISPQISRLFVQVDRLFDNSQVGLLDPLNMTSRWLPESTIVITGLNILKLLTNKTKSSLLFSFPITGKEKNFSFLTLQLHE